MQKIKITGDLVISHNFLMNPGVWYQSTNGLILVINCRQLNANSLLEEEDLDDDPEPPGENETTLTLSLFKEEGASTVSS